MLEIERKYLLKPTVNALLESLPHTCKTVEQYYTKASQKRSVRYRKIGDKYYKTIKKGQGAIREEIEREISKKVYEKHLHQRIGSVIQKKRCFIEVEEREYTVDLFADGLEGLALMEVEFEKKKAFKKFRLPQMLEAYVEKEVSEEEAYTNKNLALFGLLLPERAPDSAIEVLVGRLRQLKEKTLYYRDRVLQEGMDEDLHQLRVSLRTAVSLLDQCAFLCLSGHCKSEKKLLKEIISITNRKRDIDVLKEQLKRMQGDIETPQLQEAALKLQNRLLEMEAREARYIKAYLQGDRFGEIMEQYTYFIHQRYPKFTSLYGRYAAKPVCSYVILKSFLKIKKSVGKIDWQHEHEKLHKLRIDFKKLRYLLENSREYYDDAAMESLIAKVKKVQTVLGEFHDAVQQRTIFESLLREEKEDDIDFLIENVILPKLHTFQQKEIDAIRKRVDHFLKEEKRFRAIFT